MKKRLALRGLGTAAVATLLVASAMAMPVAGRSVQSNGADKSTGTGVGGVGCAAIFQLPAGRFNLMATVQVRDTTANTRLRVYLAWGGSDGTAVDLSTGTTGAASVHLQRHVTATPQTATGWATVKVVRATSPYATVCNLTRYVTLKTR